MVFVPRLVDREEIAAVVEGLGRNKLTLISVPGASLPARELQELGVARVSTGPFTQRVALTALQDATAELVAGGALPAGDARPQLTDGRPPGTRRAAAARRRRRPGAPGGRRPAGDQQQHARPRGRAPGRRRRATRSASSAVSR